MAMYSAFDESCDSSALLGLIRNIDTFPQSVKMDADKIRVDIRNSWAHCNFTEWNSMKFVSSFQQMHQLALSINLSHADRTILIGNLTKWETNGLHFLLSSTIGLDIAREIIKETRLLAEYILLLSSETELAFGRVKTEILTILNGMETVWQRIQEIETRQLLNGQEIQDVKVRTENLIKEQTMIGNLMTQVKAAGKQTLFALEDLKGAYGATVDKIKDIETDQNITFDKMNDITHSIKQIESEIRDLKYYSHIRPAGKIFVYPPNRIKCFVGRRNELELLEQQLVNKNAQLHDQAICGLGGCGKTTLAIEFAWVYERMYPGSIFWMSADSDEALENSILNLSFDINPNGENFKQTLIQTLKWISQLPERWLIVVDNMDKDEMTWNLNYLLLGTWKRNTHGHILVTSRRNPIEIEESLKISFESCIYLATLTQEEGLEFLRKRTGNDNEEENEQMCNLILELGGLPLALEQAGAHIKVLKCSFGEYMERFKKKRLELLRSARPVSTEMTKERLAVSTTWQLNIEYIHKHSEQEGLGTTAVVVMETAAFLFADEIPIELINDGTPQVVPYEYGGYIARRIMCEASCRYFDKIFIISSIFL